jgi:ribosomal-protein-alanine N-acetyltransferase
MRRVGAPLDGSVPRLETARLLLRGFAGADFEAYCSCIFADPEVASQFAPSALSPRQRTRMAFARNAELWRERRYGLWAVVDKSDGAFLGHCGFLPLDGTPEVEIGYAIARSHWGRGLATEAAGAALRYGFEQAGLDRIVAITRPENAASQKVMKKIGLRFEKDAFYYKLAVKYYALNRADYRPT